MYGLHTRYGLLDGVGVGETDIFDGHTHQAADDVEAVLAGFHHAGDPVEGGIGVARPDRFVECGDQVEVLFARLVVEENLAL